MKTSAKDMDMLHGSMWDKILKFALPLAASSMLQQLFNSADVAVVGRFAGSRALAAVGSNGPIINLLINIFVGLSVGSNVVIARYIGQNKKSKISSAVHTSMLTALISGIFLTVLGFIASEPMLRLISTPDDIINLATLYLKIYFLGMPFIMIYNFGAAVLRSCGDTKRPFLCLVAAGIVNVILNLILVIIFDMGVAGVGIATVVSNIISSSLVVYFLMHSNEEIKLEIKKLRIDMTILKDIARIGVPAGLQSTVFSVSNICIQTSLNKLGSEVVAASAAAINLEIFAYYILNAFSQANVTFTSQNYGAGNFKRCNRSAALCIGMGAAITMLMCLIFIIFANPLISIYTNEQAIKELAYTRMLIILPFQFVNAGLEITSGSIRGMGYSLVPAIISVAGVCGLRLVWVYTVFASHSDFVTLTWVYPISWILTAAAITISYFIIRKKAYSVSTI